MVQMTTPECLVVKSSFRILPGRWCGEEKSRQWDPMVTKSKWDVLLRDNGFSTNDLVIKNERAHYVSVIVYLAVASLQDVNERSKVLTVADDRDEKQNSLALRLVHEAFNKFLYHAKTISFSQITDNTVGATEKVISLADLDGSLLAELSTNTFHLVQRWI